MGKMVERRAPMNENFNRAMKELPNYVSKVGWFESAKYDDPKRTPVAYVAAIMDNGYVAGHIPPRPFVDPTIENYAPEWSRIMGKAANAIIDGRMSAFSAMQLLGLRAAEDTVKTISEIREPELAESTILARRNRSPSFWKPATTSTTPLNDSGKLIATLTSLTEIKE